MKIISLILDGFRGFRLRQINHFEYRPTQKTQVILGSNGAGKSSLMRELSPLPANAADYAKGGKKEITIQHEGRLYILKSLFEADGTRYVFEVDGENLNPGHTVTVFKELVKQHFNYTPEVHALLTGKMKFRSMSVAERRNWFTKISDVDYTYAIKYHQRLKDAIRDLQGALKRNQERLVHETEKCLTEKGEQQLRQTVTELTHILNTLIDHRKPKLSQPSHYVQQVAIIDESLESDLTRLEKLLATLEGEGIPKSLDELQQASITLQVALQSYQREITERGERLNKQQGDLDAVTRSSASSLEEVQRTIKELESEHTDILNHLRCPVHFDDPVSAASAFESIRSSLEDIFTQLSQCPRLDYTRTSYQELLQHFPNLQQTALKAKAAEQTIFAKRKELELYRAKEAVNCPKCQHSWYLNYDEAMYAKVVREHEFTIQQVNAADKAVTEAEKAIGEHQAFFELLGKYNSLTVHFQVLEPYWAWVRCTDHLTQNPDMLLAAVQTMANDLQYHVKANVLKERLKEQQKLEQLMLNTKQLDKDKLEKEIQQETEALIKAQTLSREAYLELEKTKSRIQTLRQIDECSQASYAALQERDMALKMLIEDSCVSALDEIIRSVKLALSQHERTLSQVDIQRGIVQNLTNQITEINAELKVLKMAQKALSPSEGLIARGMTGFINHFVKQVNQFIARIWLYPLELIPIEVSDDEALDLDYRFSVNVNDDLPVPDVSLCSAGMQEVIDLAFAAVSMKYLGLSNFPIFLDEFAAALDPAHRQSAYTAIDHLIESTDYSQVYLVSHYQEGYSSLSAAEILVLCDNNVQLPAKLTYNQHVILQ